MMAVLQAERAHSTPTESTTPLKVAIATMAPFVGGAEVAAERLALGLQAAGHEVFLLVGTAGAALERFQQAGVCCIHAPMVFTDKWHWFRYWRAKSALRGHLQAERPDVIHSNDLTTHQIVADAARGLNVPRICHHRFCYEASFTEWLIKYGAEHHLYVSQALMDMIGAYGEHWRTASRAVLYDGLPLPAEPTSEARAAARARLSLPAARTIVVFAGQIIERKGVADLIHAWAKLDATLRETADLLIIGDDLEKNGEYRVEMQRLAAQLGCPARFLGFQKNVAEWLLAADVSVVPSHVEPLGNATLEAMAYALPVIGGNVGGIPEMIVHDETGLLVPARSPDQLRDALARLLSDRPTRERLGRQGRQRCEKLFSLEAHTQAALQQYRQVIQRWKGARTS